jgi:hypothetical protein
MSGLQNISLFIPHVFPNFDQKYVSDVFAELGDVERVDFVPRYKWSGEMYNSVYVHFKSWYDNKRNRALQNDLNNKIEARIYHDDPWYWIVLPNNAKKHMPGERKPRLDLTELNAPENVEPENVEPEKPDIVCPDAPKKPSYAKVTANNIEPVNLEDKFDEYVHAIRETEAAFEEDLDASEEAAQMAEIEAELEAEDENLVSMDWRYIQAIETENMWLHAEVAQLRTALINIDLMYQAEKAKVRAFSSSVDL